MIPWGGAADSIGALRLPLLDACARVRAATGSALTFGLSRPVSALDDYCDALAEAREAMAIGANLGNPNGVFTLDDVGHHLLLSRVSGVGSVRDRYATAIARIAEYDRVKGTELLETLAVFLHFRSQSAASRELFVHRNTLNQRLIRASRLSGFDVLESAEWFPLQLALKVHQARGGASADRIRETETQIDPDDATDGSHAL
ncbi:PucR family transcriptional regulator [Mycolicibacterium sp.]|uniref:PucR family transcriptional regulator n=1 Tax=Mycolicibacterium sp. TaxID=2320850 RepID=UPI003D0F5A0B